MTSTMRYYPAMMGVAALLTLSGVAAAWQAIRATTIQDPRKGAAVSIVSQLNFRYDSAFMWSMLTSMKGVEAITGLTVDKADEREPLKQAGDWAPAASATHKGRIVVTRFESGRELRLVFEPDDASHLIGMRFLIATAGNGTVIQYWSQHTDFGGDVDDSAAKAEQRIWAAANAFRALADSRVQPGAPTRGH